MRLLDVCCGVGGASQGYANAGFDVHGLDLRQQRHYPFPFLCMDALEALERIQLDRYSLIHASPPCQRFSKGAASWGDPARHPDLLSPIRRRLQQWGGPYVIENITNAPLVKPVVLCGQQFGLGVFRHRAFETSWPLAQPKHQTHSGRIGDGHYFTVAGHTGGRSTRDRVKYGSADDWRTAMGISWATRDELAQAIPPAYTQWIGEQWKRTA